MSGLLGSIRHRLWKIDASEMIGLLGMLVYGGGSFSRAIADDLKDRAS